MTAMIAYIVEKFPTSELSFQRKWGAFPGGLWSTKDLQNYLNSDPHPGFVLFEVVIGTDAVLFWRALTAVEATDEPA